jgi:hypothetical protein
MKSFYHYVDGRYKVKETLAAPIGTIYYRTDDEKTKIAEVFIKKPSGWKKISGVENIPIDKKQLTVFAGMIG